MRRVWCWRPGNMGNRVLPKPLGRAHTPAQSVRTTGARRWAALQTDRVVLRPGGRGGTHNQRSRNPQSRVNPMPFAGNPEPDTEVDSLGPRATPDQTRLMHT